MFERAEVEVDQAAEPSQVTPSPGSCTACGARAAAEDGYIEHAFGTPQHFSRSVEAIVDTLGYCAAHGELVADRAGRAVRVAEAVVSAVERLAAMLADEATFGDRVREIFFRAGRDCPACRHVERTAATSLSELQGAAALEPDAGACARLRHLCFPHFKRLYVGGSAQQREAWLAQYREDFGRALSAHVAEEQDAAEHATAWATRPLLSRVAGETPRRPEGKPAVVDSAQATTVAATLHELLDGDACPVCRQVAAARARWLNAVALTLRTGQPAWLTFPSCAEHVHAVAALGDGAAAATAARHAGEVALSILDRRLPPFTAPESAPETAEPLPPRRWRGRKALRRYDLQGDAQGAKRPRSTNCAACERLAVARDAAIGRLIDALHHQTHRDAYARGYGLCMRHFAQAYLFAGGLRWRTFLAEVQIDRLRRTRAALAECLEARSGDPSGSPPLRTVQQGVALALVRLGSFDRSRH